jgi:hypothetical protein
MGKVKRFIKCYIHGMKVFISFIKWKITGRD